MTIWFFRPPSLKLRRITQGYPTWFFSSIFDAIWAICSLTIEDVYALIHDETDKRRSFKERKKTKKKMAGPVGFEPTNAEIKTRCLTTWRRPNKNDAHSLQLLDTCQACWHNSLMASGCRHTIASIPSDIGQMHINTVDLIVARRFACRRRQRFFHNNVSWQGQRMKNGIMRVL